MKALAELATSPNQKVLIMPMEATGVLGSLAGIGEIAKATFGTRRLGGGGGSKTRAARRRASRADRRRPASPPPATRRRHKRATPC